MKRFKGFGTALVMLALSGVAGCNQTTTSGIDPTKKTDSGKPVVKQLTVTAAAQQSLAQGDTDEVSITLDRDNFDAPVNVRLMDLPMGVTADQAEFVVPADESMATVTLKAAPDAAIGDHTVRIVSSASGVDENVQTFTLTINEG